MKTVFLFCICVFVLFPFAHSQENIDGAMNWRLGISYSGFGENDFINFDSMTGAPSYNGDGYWAVGVHLIRPINSWLEIETGLEYVHHQLEIEPVFIPGFDMKTRYEQFDIINLPLSLRANFLKYVFINGGILIDVDTGKAKSINSQDGIGAMFGIGLKYEFNFGATVFINPYTKAHALLSFASGRHEERAVESGIRVGVSYPLGNH